MEPGMIVSIVSVIAVVVFGILTARHNSETDVAAQIEQAKEAAAREARVETLLGGIRQDTQEIKSDMKGLQSSVQDLNERMIKVEQSTKSAHHRIDTLVKKEGETDDGR
jgi:septal ring factor EnvC (AmiA/AmiB activator)